MQKVVGSNPIIRSSLALLFPSSSPGTAARKLQDCVARTTRRGQTAYCTTVRFAARWSLGLADRAAPTEGGPWNVDARTWGEGWREFEKRHCWSAYSSSWRRWAP